MNRLRSVAVALAVVVLVAVAVTRLISANGPTRATTPRGLDGVVVPGAGVIRWSPDSTKLAVIAAGEVVVVRVADGEELARRGATVVDVAWMPDAERLVLVEGPTPTGQVVAMATTGRVVGTTALRPSIAFGQGRGLSVNSTGTQAVAVSATRDVLGGATHHDLAVVQLQTGATRVFPSQARDESNPVFVDETTIAYAAASPGGELRLFALDAVSGSVNDLGVIHDGPFGVLASGEVVVGHRAAQGAYRLDAVDLSGGSRVLGQLEADQRPVAIDRFGTRALVRRHGGLQGTRLTIAVLSK